MENQNVTSAISADEVTQTPISGEQKPNTMRVYRKKSTFKGATDNDFWYSATRSDGLSVICVFKFDLTTASAAFEISNIVGNVKSKTETVKGIEYTNLTYYIQSCTITEIEGTALPV